MIISLLVLPLLGVLILLPLARSEHHNDQNKNSTIFFTIRLNKEVQVQELMKNIALFVSLLNLLISIYM